MLPIVYDSRRRAFFASLITLLVACSLVSGQEMELTLERVGHWGGCSTDIRIAGERAYLAVGPRVVVLDVSTPGAPIFLGESEPLTDVIMALDAEGDYVYAATYEDGLHVLDVSNPERIIHLGSDTPGIECRGIAVVGDYVYVGIFDGLLYTYDIRNPQQPVLVDTDETTGYVHDVKLIDGYLYVPNWGGVDIYDISKSSNPEAVTTIPVFCFNVASEDGILFIVGGAYTVDIWDVHDPYHPVHIAPYDVEYVHCHNVISVEGYLYGAYADRIHIIDFRDVTNPQYLGCTMVEGIVQEICDGENTLYVANSFYGMAAYDISTLEHLEMTGIYDVAAHGEIIGVYGDHAYMSGYRREVQILDIDDEKTPRRNEIFPQGQGSFEIIGDHLYIAAGRYDQALIIAAIGDDGGLTLISNTPMPGTPDDIDLEGNYAYIASYRAGLIVVDVSAPEAPVICGICPIETPTAARVDIQYPYAYFVPRYTGTWYVVDVSDPYRPHVVTTVNHGVSLSAVTVAADLLFVGKQQGFDIYSIANPESPVLLSEFYHPIGGTTESMVYLNNRVYKMPKLAAVDVTDPAQPRLVGENVRLSWGVEDVELVDKYLFAAQTHTGLSVYEIHLIPDIDRDGRVDGADLATLLLHYGAAAGSPGYLAEADFDRSGRVDLSDLAKLLSQYGDSVEE